MMMKYNEGPSSTGAAAVIAERAPGSSQTRKNQNLQSETESTSQGAGSIALTFAWQTILRESEELDNISSRDVTPTRGTRTTAGQVGGINGTTLDRLLQRAIRSRRVKRRRISTMLVEGQLNLGYKRTTSLMTGGGSTHSHNPSE